MKSIDTDFIENYSQVTIVQYSLNYDWGLLKNFSNKFETIYNFKKIINQ